MEQMENQTFKQLEEVDVANKRVIDQCKRLDKDVAAATKDKHTAERKCSQVSFGVSFVCLGQYFVFQLS